jgi:hypothetical protein
VLNGPLTQVQGWQAQRQSWQRQQQWRQQNAWLEEHRGEQDVGANKNVGAKTHRVYGGWKGKILASLCPYPLAYLCADAWKARVVNRDRSLACRCQQIDMRPPLHPWDTCASTKQEHFIQQSITLVRRTTFRATSSPASLDATLGAVSASASLRAI